MLTRQHLNAWSSQDQVPQLFLSLERLQVHWIRQWERGRESSERISMYKYKHYYILEKCLSYSPGPSKRLEGSGWPGLGCSAGKGKSLMLLTSNNKSCSYLPPCLIKYFAKKTRLIDSPRLSILHRSSSVAVAPAELHAKWP